MAGFGYIKDAHKKAMKTTSPELFTIGLVVDTNDPQQMGRVRAFCPAWGDSDSQPVSAIHWAMYVSPLGGVTNMGKRGTEEEEVSGPVAYGMWNIPKVGAYVLVGRIDGDNNFRFYVGCIHPQYMTHTMPHGRFTWNDTKSGTPDGPLDTFENPIEPLYSNLKTQFTKKGSNHASGTPSDPHRNLEWRTRGVDNQVSAIGGEAIRNENDGPGSEIADHEPGNFGFTTVTEEDGSQRVIKGPGYGVDQQEPDHYYENTNGTNYDSLIYSWTTPGFHSISMDDRHENSRIRIRTTSGHQIIMDDTNERIYINAAGGESWIEIDKAGNIDIYASKDISTHAGGDISFTADKTFRVQAKEGIHLVSDDEVRIHAKSDLHMKSNTTLYLESGTNTHIKSGQQGRWTTGSTMHHKSGDIMYFTGGSDIHLNGPPAQTADSSKESFVATRIPEHEPWARVYSDPASADKDTGNSFTAKPASYTDKSIGKVDRDGAAIPRNPNWHR